MLTDDADSFADGGVDHVDTGVSSETDSEAQGGARARPAPGVALEPSWLEHWGTAGVAKIVILVGLMTWLYWGHFYRLYKYWQQPDWSHGFVIPLFSLYLIHSKRKELLSGSHPGSLCGLVLMVLSAAVYAASIYLKVEYPQPLSIVTMIAGIVLLLSGWRTAWLTLFPICFLILAIPPPPYLYRAITQPLQQGAAALATGVLNLLPGAEVERSGINITYFMDNGDSSTFTVAGACSGMRSLMAFVALGLAMAYFTPRPIWQRLTMAVVVVPVALFCNVLRVIVTGSLQMYNHADLATGTAHTVLGFMVFGLGFVIYMAILWVLDHLFIESPSEPDGDVNVAAGGAA